MAPGAPASAVHFLPEGLLPDLLAVSLTAVNLLRPLYGPGGELENFAVEYLNPAGQRMMGLPERPGGTLLTHFPHAVAAGILAYYRRVYETGDAGTHEVSYQADGLDSYFRLAARRSGELLVVSFTDAPDQPRPPVEQALRESQAAEQAARADAEAQRQRFYEVLLQLPAQVAIYHGPDHVYQFVNPRYQQYFNTQTLLGRSVREVFPEVGEQGIFALMDRVYQTGEPFTSPEVEVWIDPAGTGHREQFFLSPAFHALRDGQGRISGLLDFSYDVTGQVRARQQLQQLNQELEARVQERTAELQAAQTDAEAQRARLEGVFRHAPAAIAVYDGPEFVFELVNPVYQALLPGRALLGKTVRQAFPEVAELPMYQTLRRVYETGLPHEERDQLIPIPGPDGQLQNHYFNFTLQARYDAQARVNGVIGFGFEVTEQVRARHQAEALQAELLATAQRQVHEREAFHQVFEQTPALIALLRAPGHRFEYVNPAYQAFFSGRQLVGLDVAEAAPELMAQGFGALLDRVYQTGETYYGSEVPFTPSVSAGQMPQARYFNFTYQAYREAGAIAGISIFAFDVTEQVRARQEREAQRRELEQLFMQAPAPIVILDGPDLVFQLVNPAYQHIFPGRELAGKPLLDALPELVGTPVPELFQGVYRTGEPVTVQELPLMMSRHQGHAPEEIYWTFTYQARRDAQGAIDGVRVFAHDVTEQVRARQTTEATAQQLRLITDALPVLIGYLDREEKYRFANQAYEPWFGQRPEQLLGRPIREIAGPQAYPTIRPHIARALAGERVEFEAEMPFRPGFTKHIRTSYIPDVHHGAVRGFYTLVSDITEQVEARQAVEASARQALALAQELATANQQLTRTNVDLDNFIYTASHDLKAPISNIEGLLYLLQAELPAAVLQDEYVGPVLTRMLSAVDRFKRTIDHLTEVSKLQKEHAAPATAVDLALVIEDVRQDLLPLLQETGARLVVDVAALPPVQFSEKNLRSVVYNLLSNALKYRSPDRAPRVEVRAYAQAAYTVLEVHDNGLGLDVAHLPRLFSMFQRFHDHVDGSGIGLYMVKRIVENAGGRIEVRSQLGAGTTFLVHLPHALGPQA